MNSCPTVCKAHLHAKHAKTRGFGSMLLENFENLDSLRYNFRVFSLFKKPNTDDDEI